MPIRNKRATLAAGLRAVGMLRILERFAARPGVLVLAYHRVGDPDLDPFYSPLISATPWAFLAEMQAIARAYRVISLDELIEAIDERDHCHVERPSVLITFDDGYRDNLEFAAPILKRLGLPATLFATTGFVDHAIVPWWDRVAHALKATRQPTITLDRPASLTLDLRNDREAAIATLVGRFIANGWHADRRDLAHLAERCEVNLSPDWLASRLFLSQEDLTSLQDAGFTLGAHTKTHRRLAGLSEDEQRAELDTRVEGARPALAYPFGGPDAFDATTRRLAREAGYRLAFALRPGVIRPGAVDRFDLPRFPVNAADTPTLLRARLALASAGMARL